MTDPAIEAITDTIEQLVERRTAIWRGAEPEPGELAEIAMRLDSLFENRNARRNGSALTDAERAEFKKRAKVEGAFRR